MLQSLTVENYALIEHLEMRLDSALNIITGETGAGKSILLGALGLLLGNKSDTSAIKDNARSCVVEGVFDISGLDLKALFAEQDWDWESVVSIRRVISPSGKSRAFVGDVPVTLAVLKELGAKLIDIHSQHQNQRLNSEQFRMESLDLVAQSADLLAKYQQQYAELQSLRSELVALEEESARGARDEEWLTHQVEELEGAKLTPGESESIEEELQILENADRIGEVLSNLLRRLDAEEVGILTQLKSSRTELSAISRKFQPAEDYASRLESVLAELKDINASASYDSERVEADPARLQKLSDRLGVIYSLCQKHRAAELAELITIRDEYAAKLSRICGGGEQIERLKAQVAQVESQAMELAVKLESKRKAAKAIFEKSICATLSQLGMAEARVEVALSRRTTLSPMGINSVDFLFSSNGRSTPQPVDKIASGGEVSRVMLSLKALLARHKQLPTIIFDEIDTGVSGQIADAMGDIISSLSTSLQVVDITHLPQVAAKGDTHFVVYKEEGRTNIKLLSAEQRVMQIATMLSGAHISDAAISQAKILLG